MSAAPTIHDSKLAFDGPSSSHPAERHARWALGQMPRQEEPGEQRVALYERTTIP